MSAIYKAIIASVDKVVPKPLQPLWQHPAGPKTIFFWAPVFKWGLVIAGLSDMRRPANTVSYSQCLSIGVSSLIWSRYSLVIVPKNYSLFSVNLFVGCIQMYQIYRALTYKPQ